MLTAVVLANGNDGDNLYPLTEDMPLAALPVGNRPLLSYQLEMLQRAGSFGEVLVVTNDRHLSRLEVVVSEYRGPLRIELVVVEEGAGSADALRTLRGRGRLAGDFALISGDTISDVPFQNIAAMHQLHGASVTVLLKQQPPRPAADKKKARDLDGTDFVGIDESRQRLLYLESAADCDGGVITVSESMLRAHPHLEVHSDLADPHVYLFAHWVLEVLDHKPHFSSAKFELLPYLVRKQFLDQANLPLPQAEAQPQQATAMSSAAATAARLAGAVRCCCYVVPHDGPYCMRACSIAAYMQANLDICKGGAATFDKAAEPTEPLREGNFAASNIDQQSARGGSVELGPRSQVKKSAVGPHCRLGAGVRLTNCVLMEGVVVHDKVHMSNCILCRGAEVHEGATLKDVQVGSNVSVEAGANVKSEALTAEVDAEDSVVGSAEED
mmetsp:Transcript_43926/g.146365  ORF Transcript_43926/g.146365 Transcript_43926/m.146365 type:complete len:441 (+) Transcript_43926:68-1390(+)